MEVTEQVERFKDFLEKHYKDKLAEKIRKGRKRLTVSFKQLNRYDYELAELILEDPMNLLKAFELAAEQFEFMKDVKNFRIRVKDTPKSIHMRVRDRRAEDYNKMLTFEGIIESKSQVKPRTISAKFECPNCLPKGTLIFTPRGLVPIEYVDEVISLDENFNPIAIKTEKIKSGEKEEWEIEGVVCGEKKKISCSGEHKWFVYKEGKTQVIQTKHLNSSCLIYRIEDEEMYNMPKPITNPLYRKIRKENIVHKKNMFSKVQKKTLQPIPTRGGEKQSRQPENNEFIQGRKINHPNRGNNELFSQIGKEEVVERRDKIKDTKRTDENKRERFNYLQAWKKMWGKRLYKISKEESSMEMHKVWEGKGKLSKKNPLNTSYKFKSQGPQAGEFDGSLPGSPFKVTSINKTSRIREMYDLIVPRYNNFIIDGGIVSHNCGNIISVLQLDAVFKEVTKCGCGRKGKFRLISKELINAFTIKLQELPEKVNFDPELQGLSVLFKDDLTENNIEEKIYQGIRVKITGILTQVDLFSHKGKSVDVDFLLDANYIEFTEHEFFDYKISAEEMKEINKIAKNPKAIEILSEEVYKKIYGYPDVKKALVLQLFGGVSDYSVNPKERGEIHVLMIGDPGEAKSDLEAIQERHALKSSRVNSKTTSGVGLVGINIRDDITGAWSIKVGPIPRAHKGITLIDEFNTLSNENKDYLLEPMESGTITMTKAAQATFKAQTSFLVACNPIDGYFDTTKMPFTQFDISQPLLTRFDLIFVFISSHDEEYEKAKAKVMLTRRYKEERFSPKFIKKYVSHAKKINPELTKDMRENYIPTLFAQFKKLTQTDAENKKFPITPRHVNIIKRLAEAKARIHLKKTVGKSEVDFAIEIMRESLKQSSVDPDTGKIDTYIIETGITTTQRNIMYVVKDTITEMSEKIKNIPVEDLLEEVMSKGEFKADRVEECIARLLRDGWAYEVRIGFLRKI